MAASDTLLVRKAQTEVFQRGMEMLTERDVRQILEDSLTRLGIDQWLRSANRMLVGRRPLELVADGDLATVMGAARAFVDGAYV